MHKEYSSCPAYDTMNREHALTCAATSRDAKSSHQLSMRRGLPPHIAHLKHHLVNLHALCKDYSGKHDHFN